jgi:ubiquinone/menaquinone biosynthesis C-methylase UbiE
VALPEGWSLSLAGRHWKGVTDVTVHSVYYIYLDGKAYDNMYSGMSRDLPFWEAQAQACAGPILELGCGTGRVAIPLAKLGYAVTGIDLADAMLSEARRKAAEQQVDVEWVKADMRDFNLGRTFRLVIIPANALCHLLTLSDFEACLDSVKRHLSPDGRFVIDVFVPKMELLLDKPGERFPFAEYYDPDIDGTVVVTESYIYEPDTQIKRVTTHHAIPGQEAEYAGALNMRMYFPQELDALIKYNGFRIDAKYGSHERGPFTANSEKQLIVCAMTPG